MAEWMKAIFYFLCALLLIGCGSDNEHKDLANYISKIKNTQQNNIKPLPSIVKYQPFTYKSSGLRSPFQALQNNSIHTQISNDVRPDQERRKHFLEEFSFDEFVMVGALKKSEEIKGIVKVNDSIYLVSKGDYLGRNHGKVREITDDEIHVIELVPSGVDSWIERPQQLRIE